MQLERETWYLQKVLVCASFAIQVVSIDFGYHNTVKRVFAAWIILSKAELVNCMTDVKLFRAKGNQVVYVNSSCLERSSRCEMEIACHLYGLNV